MSKVSWVFHHFLGRINFSMSGVSYVIASRPSFHVDWHSHWSEEMWWSLIFSSLPFPDTFRKWFAPCLTKIHLSRFPLRNKHVSDNATYGIGKFGLFHAPLAGFWRSSHVAPDVKNAYFMPRSSGPLGGLYPNQCQNGCHSSLESDWLWNSSLPGQPWISTNV